MAKKQWITRDTFRTDPRWHRARRSLIAAIAALLLAGWLAFTPEGFFGKLGAIAYAVCHRAPSHSFFVHDHQFPLCARCTGMYLGALIVLLYQANKGRRQEFPAKSVLLPLAVLFLFFAVDGINSLLSTGGSAFLYTPSIWLRLTSGIGMGWGIAALLVPAFHQSVWQEPIPEPLLRKPVQLLLLAVLSALPVLAIVSDVDFLLYPAAVLSTLTVPLFLAIIYTVLLILLTFRENTFSTWKQLWPWFAAGFVVALLQIFVFDWLRYTLTGTWAGFPL
ncbi:MAG: DUF2085 domain-containing protein [Anaerolineae bacterium]|jgi:uncharacterized membrane protein|nr:DUF2085 domain-containing protein [Anaerolineae bacterium]